MHEKGINMRHLGLVLKVRCLALVTALSLLIILHLQATSHATWQTIIKTEMVARALKTLLREHIRAVTYKARASSEQPYIDVWFSPFCFSCCLPL